MPAELYISLLNKKRQGTLTPPEQADLAAWLAQSAEHRLVAQQVDQAWELSGGFTSEVDFDADADFERLERRIAAAERPEAKRVALPRRWMAIAAALVLLLAATWVFRQNLPGQEELGQFATTDTPAAQSVALADGSKVWLNAGSSLRFFTDTKGGERRVALKGEAFFEVAKNPEKPFVVQTELGEVTVLGTSFNVKADSAEPKLEVNVSTGVVRLQPAHSQQQLVLKANETGIFDQAKGSLVKAVGAANNTAAWHTGRLVFENTPLQEVLRQLSALHGVALSASGEAIEQCPLTVTFDKTTLDAALQTLGTILGAEVVKSPAGGFRLSGGRCH